MISQRKRGLQTVLVLFQGLLIIISLVLCLELTSFFKDFSVAQIRHYPIYALVMMIGLFIELARRSHEGKQVDPFSESFPAQHRASLHQTLYAVGALFAYLTIARDNWFARSTLLPLIPLVYLILLFSNRYLWRLIAYPLFRGVRKGRILLIGTPAEGVHLKQWLKSKEIYGMDTIGYLSDEPQNEGLEGFCYLGTTVEAETTILQQEITQVILLQLPESADDHMRLMSTLNRHGLRLLIYNNLEEKLNHPVIYMEDDGHHFISLRKEPLENPFNRMAKRTLDIAVALPVILFVLPVFTVLVWVLQRIYSPGPVFFRQMRAGIQNNQFLIWKFRTMHVNDEQSRQATVGDARIYPGGQFLRRFSIDELPQFLNVLGGSMSVTGPRPHLIEHNEQFAREIASYPIRTVVKPGITGLAQVRGFRGEARTSTDIALRLESDITYLENWRLTLDLAIILRTAWQMLFPPPTAY
jgi:putative colanic acid biosynthesis UDP-glucose lipid carrier transferase